ncbi:MAG: efflux transporter outer membrane subunit [Planctomycetota bacterium]
MNSFPLTAKAQRNPPQNSNGRGIVLLLTAWLAMFHGCAAVGPDYSQPDTVMPDVWHQELTRGLARGQADMQTWWTTLNDPILNSLIEQASAGNLDVQTAASRIRQARALLGIAAGEYFPQVDATGFYSRDRVSENGLLAPAVGSPDQTNLHQIGVDSTWEIDVFGRISRSVESAKASLEASVENYRDVLVLLYAEVALNYIEVRSLQARIQYALDNIEVQNKTMKLTEDRLAAGLVPELDVQQAHLNLANTESVVPALRSQRMQTINRLSVLLGQAPGQLERELAGPAPIPDTPQEAVVGLPAELLRQRPDIRRAERNLASQTAQIGVATAELYPAFSLSGTFALQAQQIKDVGDWDSRTWRFGPSFRWNIFDGDRIKSSIRLEEARTEEAFTRYGQTILLALEEVEDAMVAYKEEQVRLQALERSVVAAQESVRLVDTLYRSGLTDFQNVLDMQRALSQQQDKLAQSEGLVLQNLVLVYKALGGGWSVNRTEQAGP